MTSGEYEQTGRHSRHPGTWTPEVRYLHAPAHARIEPESLVEQTVPGLRKFDLGTVPASVTPPRSWRRAAWFAVAASVAVIVGLAFAASALMGPPRGPNTIDALPNYPSMPFFAQTPTNDMPPTDAAKPTHTATSKHTEPLSNLAQTHHTMTDSSPQATTTDSATVPSAPSTPPVYVPPVRETTPMFALAMNNPKEIGDRTEAFYKSVVSDPDSAYQMTTGDMRQQGADGFKARYADIRSIQVKRISIDPNQGTTVSEMTVTKKDGGTYTEVRRLRFTSGSNPKISSEVTH